MTKMTIEKLYTTSTKKDEIDFLKKVKAAAGEDTYLAGLFTDDFMAWMERRINDDWSTDLLGDYNHECEVHLKNATELVKLREEYKKLVERAEVLRRNGDQYFESMTSLEEQLKMTTESAASFQEHIKALKGEVHGLQEREGQHLEVLNQLSVENRALRSAIRAVVFDEEGADHERAMLRMILTGGRSS